MGQGRVKEEMIMKREREGQFNQCNPCLPVEVSIRAMELEEEEYYPQVWKCICHDNIFSP